MTSNIGSNFIQKMQGFGFSNANEDINSEYNSVKVKVGDALKDFFKPEFLNRLDEVIIFDILTKENINKIVSLQIEEVKKRLLDKDISLEVSNEAIEYIGQNSYDTQYGARTIRRYIQSNILNKVATMIINKTFEKNTIIEISLKKEELSVEIKKKSRAKAEVN